MILDNILDMPEYKRIRCSVNLQPESADLNKTSRFIELLTADHDKGLIFLLPGNDLPVEKVKIIQRRPDMIKNYKIVFNFHQKLSL
jgi:hypothetical protein